MSKIDLTSDAWCDLIFTGRNQTYGAYKLRKGTSKRNIMSIIIMLLAAALIASFIGIKSIVDAKQQVALNAAMNASVINNKKVEVKKKAPIKVEEQKPVEKVKSSVKFTAPVIKKDSEVKPEDELKTQDQLMNNTKAIGGFDVKGNDDAGGEVLKAKEIIAQPEPPKEEENKVFDVVEQMPAFPGGPSALMSYLSKNIKYPVVAEENGVQGRVIVTFVVEKDGSITDVHIAKSVDPSLDKEAQRVVRSMPNWIPGKQNGSAVRVKYTVPVTFRLQ